MDRIEGDISVVKGGQARSRGVEAAPDIADDLETWPGTPILPKPLVS